MWTRAELKQSAKGVLRENYWMAFAVCLVYGLIASFGTGGASGGASSGAAAGRAGPAVGAPAELLPGVVSAIVVIGLFGLMLGLALVFALQFFVYGPLEVGLGRYFLESRQFPSGFSRLFSGFQRNYLRVAGGMFVTELFIGLWSLLLIVPGIVKALAWSQVPYLLAENPNLTGARAREISAQMTDGQKWEIFLLQLSFLGWYLLGALACGVGVLFVDPYVQATHAELYARLRDRALREGFATLEELPGLCPAA